MHVILFCKMKLNAVVLGASGLVGAELLALLLDHVAFANIYVYVRKKLPISHNKLHQIVTDFKDLNTLTLPQGVNVIFSCLGTTNKNTPDKKQYRYVEYHIPLHFAHIAKQQNVQQFHVVSAMDSNKHSGNFYTKLKGEVEEALESVGISNLNIYRPSLLVGKRNENRPLERWMIAAMKVVNPLLRGPLKKYRSISAKQVALAMLNQAVKQKQGTYIFNSEEIKQLS